jgi:hypothetical protein
MKLQHKKGSNLITFIMGERKWENKLKAIQKWKGWILDTLLRKSKKKPETVFISYCWGYSEGKKARHFIKEFTDKEKAEHIYRMGIVSELTNKKLKKEQKYSFAIDRKYKTYTVRAVEIHDRPDYYFTSFKLPSAVKLTSKSIMKYIYFDLLDKFEYYAYQLNYDKPHNLRSVAIKVIYENTTNNKS